MPTPEQLRLLRQELARIGCYSWEFEDIYLVMCGHMDTYGWPPAERMHEGFCEAIERMVALGDLYGREIHTMKDYQQAFTKPGYVLSGEEWENVEDFDEECSCGGIFYNEGNKQEPRWVCLNCGLEKG